MNTPKLPFRFGNTGPEQRMILDANDNYVCSIQIQQCGGGVIAASMEGAREVGAQYILRACNSHDELLATLKHLVSRGEKGGALGKASPVWNEARSAIAKAEGRS